MLGRKPSGFVVTVKGRGRDQSQGRTHGQGHDQGQWWGQGQGRARPMARETQLLQAEGITWTQSCSSVGSVAMNSPRWSGSHGARSSPAVASNEKIADDSVV